jgi:hypothetical protein
LHFRQRMRIAHREGSKKGEGGFLR